MKYPVTVEYSHAGAQPPVYLAGSWTNPPWEPQEMAVSDQRTEEGHLRFVKHFDAVDEGEYQYKFRLGPGDWWVTDDTAATVTDDSGNKNNKLVVKPPPPSAESPAIADSASQPSDMDAKAQPSEVSSHDTSNEPTINGTAPPGEHRSAVEATPAPSDQSEGPSKLSGDKAVEEPLVPFTVVETVPDQEQPVYGDLETAKLNTDESKRTEDAEPDFEYERPPTAPAAETASDKTPSNPEIPQLVVEKTDDTLRHGDDFGSEATPGQKLAHAMRRADAEPDETVVSPKLNSTDPQDAAHDENDANAGAPAAIDESIPLLPHEKLDSLEVDDSEELEVPLLSHERSIEADGGEALKRNDSAASGMEPVKFEGDMPIFSHELVPDETPFSPTFSVPRNKSTASLRSMRSLKSADEDEDENDPSLERFPTQREEIYEQIRRCESRLPEDSSIVEAGHSPVRNGEPSPGLISTSVTHSSPLNPITEDDQDADLEENGTSHVQLPAPLSPVAEPRPKVEVTPLPVVKQFSQKDLADQEERNQDNPLTPPLTPKEKARDSSPTPNDDPQSLNGSRSTTDDVAGSEASADESHEVESDEEDPIDQAPQTSIEPEGPRQRKPSLSSRATVTSKRSPSPAVVKSNEGFFRAFWRALFGSWLGPLTQWLFGIFGYKQNTA